MFFLKNDIYIEILYAYMSDHYSLEVMKIFNFDFTMLILPYIMTIHGKITNVDLKVVVLGAASVGKTSIINRYCNGTFSDETLSTIGAGFFTHSTKIDDTEVTLMIWDTAGQERFRSVAPSLLRGANGVVLVYDSHSQETFDELELYIEMFLDNLSSALTENSMPVLILGNKIDLEGQLLSKNIVEDWMRKNRIELFYHVSAKTGENINEAFDEFLKTLIKPDNFYEAAQLQLSAKPEEKHCAC
ncbi:small GTP-binding protein [Tritrichomonas foetus]|uniref:Small GTP-binding protein n=1 Tax=Tritrichomonas foetus TaxID=1144522 RepID=A0A1J4K118_9EUKA|nr:small GTP-binding protein [Tritrichomonas foetus]|eukprot:OHT04480.1 small GTP-binding protein [Tritrichomonas foetus]